MDIQIAFHQRLHFLVNLPDLQLHSSSRIIISLLSSSSSKAAIFFSKEYILSASYCLKMAHNECKIGRKDLKKIAHLFGTNNERDSRDLLEYC